MGNIEAGPTITELSKRKWEVMWRGAKYICGSRFEAEEKAKTLIEERKKKRRK